MSPAATYPMRRSTAHGKKPQSRNPRLAAGRPEGRAGLPQLRKKRLILPPRKRPGQTVLGRRRLREATGAVSTIWTSTPWTAASRIPFRVRILIPSTEMWMQGEERPDYVLRNMSGAVIDFVVTHVDREAGFAIASRRLALRTRRYYFSTQPSMNRAGTRVKCHVLAVGPRRCLVECGGYDIDLTQREMRYTAIPDLREQYHTAS